MLVDEGFESILPSTTDDDRRAFLHEARGQGFSNPACGSNDKDLLVDERHDGVVALLVAIGVWSMVDVELGPGDVES